MVWSVGEPRVFGFYHLDYVEALSPVASPVQAKQSGVLQGKSKSNTHLSEHQEVQTGNDLGLWKSLNL